MADHLQSYCVMRAIALGASEPQYVLPAIRAQWKVYACLHSGTQHVLKYTVTVTPSFSVWRQLAIFRLNTA